MTLQSRFQSVDSTIDPSYFIRYVDRLSTNPEIIRCRRIGLDFIAGHPVGDVVEIGCGVGDVCAQIAMLNRDSQVLGLDKSRTMLEESRRRHGNVSNLKFGEGSFTNLQGRRADAVWIERVLVHCENPESALGMAADSLGSNGKLVVIEPDWGTLVVTGVDPKLVGPWTADITNVQLSGTVGRKLPLVFKKNSIALESHEIAFLPFESKADLNNLIDLQRTISGAVTHNVMSPSEALELTSQLAHADENEELFGFVALVIALGRKVRP